MRTELSSTELRVGIADLRALLAFRRSGLGATSKRRLWAAGALVLLLTVAAIVIPAHLQDPLNSRSISDLITILPTFYLAFLVLAFFAATTSGGGRELIPRDQAVAFPISTVTEHLGALLMAPLNIAWLIQAWTILGLTAYVLGPDQLAASTVPVLLWIALATAAGQVVAWVYEGLRRGRHGVLVTRVLAGAVAAVAVVLIVTENLTALLDRSPTVEILLAAAYAPGGAWERWSLSVGILVLLVVASVLLGLVPARWALHRPQREELRMESGHREPPPNPRSDLVAMVRVDRASIWRSVPLRRGLLVLGMMPGAVAVAGALTWDVVIILPGLVASGGALLFGVNAWCLDGRGALWRDSLPVPPNVVFTAKVVVLFEVLLVAGGLTILLAALRAGAPTPTEAVAVVVALLVVSAQVVDTSLRWSVAHPYSVDLRSARATPAPPVVMAGYSARLATKTTLLGMVFAATSTASAWWFPALVAVPFACWSAYRLRTTAAAWADPVFRARVIAVVAS